MTDIVLHRTASPDRKEFDATACPQCGMRGVVHQGKIAGHSSQWQSCPASYKHIDTIGRPNSNWFMSWYTGEKMHEHLDDLLDEALRLVQPGTSGWRDPSFAAAERRQQIRARVHAQVPASGVQSERRLKTAAAITNRTRTPQDVTASAMELHARLAKALGRNESILNQTWAQLVEARTKEPNFELMYSSGGHGGPYQGVQAAYKGAKRLLKGRPAERAITIARYTQPGESGAFKPLAVLQQGGGIRRVR